MSDQSGLSLFRQTASAAGNFPGSRRGYDRQAVDEYVLGQERELAQARKAVADLQYRLNEAENAPEPEPVAAEPVDYTHLGGNATEILRLAQVQSRELTDRAAREAARIVEEGRRAGATARSTGEQEAEDIKVAAVADLRQMRSSMDRQASEQLNQARSESDSMVVAAQRHAESMTREAQRKVSGMLEAARLEAASVRQAAEKDAAKIRSDSAIEREQLLARLTAEHDTASSKAATMLAEATSHHQQAQATFAQDAENAARARSEAMADAERVRINAAREADTIITKARKQATEILLKANDSAQWKAEEMRRETESLGLRKQALMAQLASLSEMAKQSAADFTDVEPLEEFPPPRKGTPLAVTESKGPASAASAPSSASASSPGSATSGPTASAASAGSANPAATNASSAPSSSSANNEPTIQLKDQSDEATRIDPAVAGQQSGPVTTVGTAAAEKPGAQGRQDSQQGQGSQGQGSQRQDQNQSGAQGPNQGRSQQGPGNGGGPAGGSKSSGAPAGRPGKNS